MCNCCKPWNLENLKPKLGHSKRKPNNSPAYSFIFIFYIKQKSLMCFSGESTMELEDFRRRNQLIEICHFKLKPDL